MTKRVKRFSDVKYSVADRKWLCVGAKTHGKICRRFNRCDRHEVKSELKLA